MTRKEAIKWFREELIFLQAASSIEMNVSNVEWKDRIEATKYALDAITLLEEQNVSLC